MFIIKKLLQRSEKNDFSIIILQSIMTMFVRVFGATSGFFLNIVIAQILIPRYAGEFFILLSMITALGQISTLGLGNLILKEMGNAKGRLDYKRLNDVFSNTIYVIISVSLMVLLCLYFSASFVASIFFEPGFNEYLIELIALGIPSVAIVSIFMSSFQAVGKPIIGLVIQSVIQPLVFCTFCLLFVEDINHAVYFYLISMLLILPFGFVFWKLLGFTKFSKFSYENIYQFKKDGVSFFFIIVIGMLISQSPILISAALVGSDEVAYISVALRIAGLTSFVLVACNMVLAPHFSYLYSKGDIKKVGDYAKKGTAFMLLLSSPLLVFMLFFPEVVLSLFGKEYINASFYLQVFACGQFINVATGAVGNILMMTGYQRDFNHMQLLNLLVFSSIITISVFFNVSPEIIVLSIFSGVVAQNLGAYFLVKKRLGFTTFPNFKLNNT